MAPISWLIWSLRYPSSEPTRTRKKMLMARTSPRFGPIQQASSTILSRSKQVEHDRPPTPNQRNKNKQHSSSCIEVPTVWIPRGLIGDSGQESGFVGPDSLVAP